MTQILLSTAQQGLVNALAAAWRDGSVVEPAPDALPRDLDTAEAMQRAFAEALDFGCGAHKLGATVEAIRLRLGLPRTFCGTVATARALPSPATIPAPVARFRIVESEPAFRFARGIPAGNNVTADDVAAAIGAVMPAIELPESRFAEIGVHGPFALVADGGAAGWAILGPETPFDGPATWDGAQVVLKIDGAAVATGRTSDIDGGPFAAVVRHCQNLCARGIAIPAGLAVLPGSCTGAVTVPVGSEAVADFGRFGAARVRFTPA
jgi:2-keto-4-pentenoate hydratase